MFNLSLDPDATLGGAIAAAAPARGINDPRIAAVINRLHDQARGDLFVFLRALPKLLAARALGSKKPVEEIVGNHLARAFIPVDRQAGLFLHQMVLATGARQVVEFGTSFGLSTLYLAAAARLTGGRVTGTEMEPHKHARATAHLAEAGLSDVAQVLLGDALETLKTIEGPVDLLFLDGWKGLYLPVLEMLAPKLRPGAVVIVDTFFTFKTALKLYCDYLARPGSGFAAQTLKLGSGTHLAVKL